MKITSLVTQGKDEPQRPKSSLQIKMITPCQHSSRMYSLEN